MIQYSIHQKFKGFEYGAIDHWGRKVHVGKGKIFKGSREWEKLKCPTKDIGATKEAELVKNVSQGGWWS